MTTTRNPWFNPDSAYSKREFTYPGNPLFTHRGVSVFKHHSNSWDYVLDGVTISQRAGFDRSKAAAVIDGILDGETLCAQGVWEHLTAHGFTPMSYAQYSLEYAAGRVA